MSVLSDNTFLAINRSIAESCLDERPGMCRMWTKDLLDLIDGLELSGLESEAREVDIQPGLTHTFVKLFSGSETYFLDGIGVLGFPSYFGSERNAPDHLQHSHSDPINLYRKLKKNRKE